MTYFFFGVSAGMKRFRWFLIGSACLAGCLLACGESSKQESAGGTSAADADSAVVMPSAIGAGFRAKGFVIVQERPAPAQRSGHKASAIVYHSRDGKNGGVVYVLRHTDQPTERVGWHWFFADAAPDSVVFTELNRDGLWDARVFFGSTSIDLLQREEFSLLGRDRSSTGAMNGASSSSAGLWMCFDGDSATAWRAPRKGAFVEIPIPLGVERAELDVQLAGDDQPARLDVYAGDQKLQTIDLSDGIARQSFRLDPAARGAESIRIEFEGGDGDSVAVSELEIR